MSVFIICKFLLQGLIDCLRVFFLSLNKKEQHDAIVGIRGETGIFRFIFWWLYGRCWFICPERQHHRLLLALPLFGPPIKIVTKNHLFI
jgi:hypothetical protein